MTHTFAAHRRQNFGRKLTLTRSLVNIHAIGHCHVGGGDAAVGGGDAAVGGGDAAIGSTFRFSENKP